jgi:hypothetical protein
MQWGASAPHGFPLRLGHGEKGIVQQKEVRVPAAKEREFN